MAGSAFYKKYYLDQQKLKEARALGALLQNRRAKAAERADPIYNEVLKERSRDYKARIRAQNAIQ